MITKHNSTKYLTKPVTLMILAVLLPIALLNIMYFRPMYAPVILDKESSMTELVNHLNENIDGLLETHTIPGAAIAIISHNQTNIITGGRADLWLNKEVNQYHIFQLASISKAHCAFAIMKLVQDGLINLDAPVELYMSRWSLPDSEFDNNEVTIRRILCHAAGLSLEGVPGYLNRDSIPKIEEALIETNVRLIYEPGSVFSYSGGGFGILQLVIEEVTGMKYDDYLQSEIFEPLNLTNTWTDWNESFATQNAIGYSNMLLPIIRTYPAMKAAAGHYSTIEDMANWVNALLYGQSILNTSSMRTMLTPQWGDTWGWALGFRWESLQNERMIWGHDGDNWGFHGGFRFAPDTRDGIIILTNGDRGAALTRELIYKWKNLLGANESEPLWEEKNQSYYQQITFEVFGSIILILVLGSAWYRGKISVHGYDPQSMPRFEKWGRRLFSFILVLLLLALVLYWGYTSLSPISWGPISYIWSISIPLIWLSWASVAVLYMRVQLKQQS